jgi:hypothetical protein
MKQKHLRKKHMKKTYKKINKRSYTRRVYKRVIKYHQQGGSEKSNVFKLAPLGHGFFSTFHSMCRLYIHSQKTQTKFYIDSKEWKYKYQKGWHDYFTSLTEIDSTVSSTRYYNTHECLALPAYTILDHINCIKEIYVLNTNILENAKSFINKINGPYKSIYIRRGDKSIEATPIDTPTIVATTGFKDDGSNIFIQTDDFTVIDEVQKLLPSCKLFTMTNINTRGTSDYSITVMSSETKKQHTEELLASIQVFLQGKECWTDHRSNVGRFHKLVEFEKVNLYPIDDSIKNISRETPFKLYSF